MWNHPNAIIISTRIHRLEVKNILKTKKVIYLSEFEFSNRDVKRFGLEILKKNGITVELWNLSRYILKDYDSRVCTPDVASWEPTRSFSDEMDIITAINTCEQNVFIVSIVDFNLNTLSIYQAISRNNIPYAVPFMNAFPAQQGSYSPIYRFINFLRSIPKSRKKLVLLSLGNEILRRFFPLFGVKSATVALVGGSKSIDFLNKPVDEKTHRLLIHSNDYDLYINERHKTFSYNKKQWVYIETYYESDPDQFFCPDDKSFKPDNSFFENLKRTFNYIEEKYDVRIVIVEHPKKPQHDICDYGNRPCFSMNTAEVIRSSDIVLSHDSTAITYAVLFNKPLIFLTSRKIESTDNGKKIQSLAKIFGVKPIFIDSVHPNIPGEYLTVNVDRYRQYIHDYVTQIDNEMNSWQILAEYLNRVY